MKYKTICRLLVRLIGLLTLLSTLPSLMTSVMTVALAALQGGRSDAYIINLSISSIVPYALFSLFAAYLFAGGKRVVEYLIPTNRPYCQECGYDLTNPASKICPECGKPHEYGVVGPLS